MTCEKLIPFLVFLSKKTLLRKYNVIRGHIISNKHLFCNLSKVTLLQNHFKYMLLWWKIFHLSFYFQEVNPNG